MSTRISEYLMMDEVSGRKVVKCAKCEHEFCPATENYKNYARTLELSPAKAGTLFKESKRFVFREFYCPGCGTMFDVEVRLKGQPFVWDASLS